MIVGYRQNIDPRISGTQSTKTNLTFVENGPDKVAAFPSHGTHHRNDMNMDSDTTQFQSPKVNETGLGFPDLENDIFELACMSAIVANILELRFGDDAPPTGTLKPYLFCREEIESFLFAVYNVRNRANDLRAKFYGMDSGVTA